MRRGAIPPHNHRTTRLVRTGSRGNRIGTGKPPRQHPQNHPRKDARHRRPATGTLEHFRRNDKEWSVKSRAITFQKI